MKIEPGFPRGPKDQEISRFRAGLKMSSENEIFERATHRGPIFCGEIETSRLKISSEIENSDRDPKFRSGSNFFDRWALWVFQFFFLPGKNPVKTRKNPEKTRLKPGKNLLEKVKNTQKVGDLVVS